MSEEYCRPIPGLEHYLSQTGAKGTMKPMTPEEFQKNCHEAVLQAASNPSILSEDILRHIQEEIELIEQGKESLPISIHPQ